MLAHQMAIVINPLVGTTNNNYQSLDRQMGRITNVFGAPPNPILGQIANVIILRELQEQPLQANNLNHENWTLINRNQNDDNVLE